MNRGKVLEPVRESTTPSTAVATVVVGAGVVDATVVVGAGVVDATVVVGATVVVDATVVVGATVVVDATVVVGATLIFGAIVVGDETQATMNPRVINAPHTSFCR